MKWRRWWEDEKINKEVGTERETFQRNSTQR
jgi:hypothetical protein